VSGPLATIRGLTAFYGDFQALFGVDLEVRASEIIALIGANGAGKSTLLKSIAGVLPAPRESIWFDGEAIGGLPAHNIVGRGIAMSPEGRRLFPSLSVQENLMLGAYRRRAGPWNAARVYELFPALAERKHAPSGALSGGQQQMAAIGRALMSNPKLLIADEISLGLAPAAIQEIYTTIQTLAADGMAMILVEQDVGLAMRMSHRLYCLREGRVELAGPSHEFSREAVREAYFGMEANRT
jgi:branched-chain amino acid transport system ATP-binding protein